jgi:hypothetical protein
MTRNKLRALTAAWFLLSCIADVVTPQDVAAQVIVVPPPTGGGGGSTVYTSSADPTINSDSGAGFSVGSLWLNTTNGRTWIAQSVSSGAAVWTEYQTTVHPGYRSAYWYWQVQGATLANTTSATTVGTVFYAPIFFSSKVVVTDVGVFISTLGSHAAFGFFANDYATMRPTGAVLCTTGSQDVSGTGLKDFSISSCPTMIGLYWVGVQVDNNAVRWPSFSTGQTYNAWLAGSATQANIQNAVGSASFQMEQTGATFPTFPSAVPASVTEETTLRGPIIQFKVQ